MTSSLHVQRESPLVSLPARSLIILPDQGRSLRTSFRLTPCLEAPPSTTAAPEVRATHRNVLGARTFSPLETSVTQMGAADLHALLHLASSAQCTIYEVHPQCCMCQCFIPFCCQVIFCSANHNVSDLLLVNIWIVSSLPREIYSV